MKKTKDDRHKPIAYTDVYGRTALGFECDNDSQRVLLVSADKLEELSSFSFRALTKPRIVAGQCPHCGHPVEFNAGVLAWRQLTWSKKPFAPAPKRNPVMFLNEWNGETKFVPFTD